MTVLVVGAGVSSLACAHALLDEGMSVTVAERSRVVGGRLASRHVATRPVDHGASYFTVVEGGEFAHVVDAWAVRGLVRPWTDRFAVWDDGHLEPGHEGPMRWAAPAGLRSLAEALAQGVDVSLQHPVREVRRTSDGVTADGESYEAVVLAMPDPQAIRLLDGADPVVDQARAVLRDRAWEPTLALLVAYPRRVWERHDGIFVHHHPVLSWIADDGARRGDLAPVWVAHSTDTFARQFLDNPGEACAPMMAALGEVVPELAGREPTWKHVQRWSFAHPVGSREHTSWFAGGLGLCGDGWSGRSRVEAAWNSGTAVARQLLASL